MLSNGTSPMPISRSCLKLFKFLCGPTRRERGIVLDCYNYVHVHVDTYMYMYSTIHLVVVSKRMLYSQQQDGGATAVILYWRFVCVVLHVHVGTIVETRKYCSRRLISCILRRNDLCQVPNRKCEYESATLGFVCV